MPRASDPPPLTASMIRRPSDSSLSPLSPSPASLPPQSPPPAPARASSSPVALPAPVAAATAPTSSLATGAASSSRRRRRGSKAPHPGQSQPRLHPPAPLRLSRHASGSLRTPASAPVMGSMSLPSYPRSHQPQLHPTQQQGQAAPAHAVQASPATLPQPYPAYASYPLQTAQYGHEGPAAYVAAPAHGMSAFSLQPTPPDPSLVGAASQQFHDNVYPQYGFLPPPPAMQPAGAAAAPGPGFYASGAPTTYDAYHAPALYGAAPTPPPPWAAPANTQAGAPPLGPGSVPSGAVVSVLPSPSPEWSTAPLAVSPSRTPVAAKPCPPAKDPSNKVAVSAPREREESSTRSMRAARDKAQDTGPPPTPTRRRDIGKHPRSSVMLPTASPERQETQQKLERSGFVMWIGNLPKGVSALQLWHFFDRGALPPDADPALPSDGTDSDQKGAASASSAVTPREGTSSISLWEFPWSVQNGVLSIYVIARSNCAFVNFDNEAHLVAMVERCNGVSLRPSYDEPPLVARVRDRDEEVEAGVAGQRGKGHHVAYAREWNRKKLVERERRASLDHELASLSVDGGGDGEHPASAARRSSDGNGSSASLVSVETSASTDSSLLRHPAFAQRFFILKSRTVVELEESVQTGTWMTQLHNEAVIDQAFRNSKDVFIFFSANQSGAWFGYARMSSGLRPAAALQPVSPQTARGSSAAADSSLSPSASTPQEDGHEHGRHHGRYRTTNSRKAHNYRRTGGLAVSSPSILEGLAYFTTTKAAGIRRDPWDYTASALGSSPPSDDSSTSSTARSAPPVLQPAQRAGVTVPGDVSDRSKLGRSLSPSSAFSGGKSNIQLLPTAPKCFSVDWVKVESVPFFASRGVRNPWRDNKQIKVSRDGTELEPGVGRVLKALIDSYIPDPQERARVKSKAVGTAGPASATSPSRISSSLPHQDQHLTPDGEPFPSTFTSTAASSSLASTALKKRPGTRRKTGKRTEAS